jgi:predicted MFS family arabinose efflux permease
MRPPLPSEPEPEAAAPGARAFATVPLATAPANPRTSRIAWTSAVIHGLVHASVLLLPALLGDLQRAFRVSLLDVLAVANAMYLAFGMAAVPAGYLADRVGSRTMLLVAAGGCTVSLVLVSVAPTFPALAAALVLLGLSAGIYHPSGLSLLSRRVASPERGRAIGIHGVGGNFGEALAPAWAAFFAARLGWRWGFASAALLALGCAALTLTLPGDGPDHPGRPPSTLRHSMAGLGRTLQLFWRSRPLRWLLLATVAGGFVYRGVLTFLPMHLASSAGGMQGASYVTSLVLVAGIVAQRLGGELADRLPRERLFLAEMALLVPILMLLGLASGSALWALALTFGFLWYLAQPLVTALTATHSDARDHGLLYGVQFAASFGVGSFATTAGGLLTTASGRTGLAFVGFGAAALLQLLAAVFLLRGARSVPSVSHGVPGRA